MCIVTFIIKSHFCVMIVCLAPFLHFLVLPGPLSLNHDSSTWLHFTIFKRKFYTFNILIYSFSHFFWFVLSFPVFWAFNISSYPCITSLSLPEKFSTSSSCGQNYFFSFRSQHEFCLIESFLDNPPSFFFFYHKVSLLHVFPIYLPLGT